MRHHRDCQVLTGDRALRIASAIGRAAMALRLRPRGLPGPQSATNVRFMDALERRIVERIDESSLESLGRLDQFYFLKLCSEDTRRIVITRMAEVNLGLD